MTLCLGPPRVTEDDPSLPLAAVLHTDYQGSDNRLCYVLLASIARFGQNIVLYIIDYLELSEDDRQPGNHGHAFLYIYKANQPISQDPSTECTDHTARCQT